MTKRIDEKSLGKHIGHACEGHLRGLLSRWASKNGYELRRALPFDFHVNPDAVLVDKANRVKMIGICAYWNNAHNSESKFYRTRSEYAEADFVRSQHPASFVGNSQTITVLYGSDGGWKEKILDDLKVQCTPLLYLPELLGVKECNALVNDIFAIYKNHWESGGAKSREFVESEIRSKSIISASEECLLNALDLILSGSRAKRKKATRGNTSTVRLPSSEIRTRYRQALGFLSLFKNEELIAWRDRTNEKLSAGSISDFAIRAIFLDLGSIAPVRAIGRSWVTFKPKQPVRMKGAVASYAPDLLDFTSWESLSSDALSDILDIHREFTRSPGSVFSGGAFDQVVGNWRGVCTAAVSEVQPLIDAIQQQNVTAATNYLSACSCIAPEAWHPANGSAVSYPTWAFAACAVAMIDVDRKVRSNFDARRQVAPSKVESRELSRSLLARPATAELLMEVLEFSNLILQGNVDTLARAVRPRLLSLDEPCSWLSDFYNTLTTNSSHNPLCGATKVWLEKMYPGYTWLGWPKNRSISLSEALESNVGRRQWQFIGKSTLTPNIIAADVKSITANNWGNKSKELYDRVAESRTAAKSMGMSIRCIGILDGDFSQEQFSELSTGIGYDEMYSFDEVIAIA